MMIGGAIDGIAACSSGDFYRAAHAKVYDAIAFLAGNNEPVDVVTVASRMSDSKTLEEAGGKGYLLDLVNTCMLASHAEQYGHKVRDLAIVRRVIAAAQTVETLGYDRPADANEYAGNALTKMMDAQGTGDNLSTSASVLIRERCKDLRKPREFITVPGFFGNLHLRKGDLVVVGGYPSHGKSSLGLWLAEEWSEKHKVAFYSYEMSKDQLADRLMAKAAGQSVETIESGLRGDDLEFVSDYAQEVWSARKLSFKMAAGMSMAQLFSSLRRFAASGGSIAVVDYLQLAIDDTGHRTNDVTRLTNGLKKTAGATGLTIIALSQFRRIAPEDRDRIKFPVMGDLRDSGSIEQDADNVCLIYSVPNPRESAEASKFIEGLKTAGINVPTLDMGTGDPADDLKLVRLDWAKLRQGKLRKWYWTFDGGRMRWSEVPR